MDQKLENLLNMALATPEDERKKTDTLNLGYNDTTKSWELIAKYHGSLDVLIDAGVGVEYLIAGYCILTVPENLVELLSTLDEIEYVEKPKRYYYSVENAKSSSCIPQMTSRDPFLTGKGVLVAVLDSGACVNIL
jgi:hypothetical protein